MVDLASGGKLDSIRKLARLLSEDPPDALLTAKDHAAKVAVLARRLSGCPVPVFVKVTNTPSQTLRRRFKRWTARLLYRQADCVIAISEGVRDDLITHFGMPPSKVQVIYNPTVTPDIPERAAKAVDHPWFQDEGPPVIVGAGRLTGQKDFATLIEAFACLRARQPARLVILGDGPLRESLRQRAEQLGVSEEVDLPGYVPDPIPYFARAALFVLSSRYEGLGNVIVEALAAARPWSRQTARLVRARFSGTGVWGGWSRWEMSRRCAMRWMRPSALLRGAMCCVMGWIAFAVTGLRCSTCR